MKFDINSFKKIGVDVYEVVPTGWKPIIGALTAPSGYKWYCNCELLLSNKEYKQALINEEVNNEPKSKII